MERLDCAGAPLRVPLRPGAVSASGGGVGSLAGAAAAVGGGPGTKKMRKRRELDALAKRGPPPSNGVHKRCGGGGSGGGGGGGLSSHDQLLSESSGDDSGAGSLPLPGGYKPGYSLGGGYGLGGGGGGGYTAGLAVKRRRPGRGPYPHLLRPHLQLQRPCGQVVRACVGLLVLACVIATLTVMWLFIDVREQVFSLRTEIEQVVAGSQAVPDDLQKIHSLSRELQQNQTQLSLRVNAITEEITNLSKQLSAAQTDLRVYSQRLQTNQEPPNVAELKTNLASIGSKIVELSEIVRNSNLQGIDTLVKKLEKNVTAVEASVSKLANATIRPQPNVAHELDNLHQFIVQVSTNFSEANSTLTKRLQWLQDDQVKDHKATEVLQDLAQNFTARIRTLEGECAKIDVQNVLNTTVLGLKEQIKEDAQRLKVVERFLATSAPATSPAEQLSQATQSSIPLAKPTPGSLVKEEINVKSLTESGIATPAG